VVFPWGTQNKHCSGESVKYGGTGMTLHNLVVILVLFCYVTDTDYANFVTFNTLKPTGRCVYNTF
jgi:hypothetical protein